MIRKSAPFMTNTAMPGLKTPAFKGLVALKTFFQVLETSLKIFSVSRLGGAQGAA